MAVDSVVISGTLPQAISGTVDLTSSGFGTPTAAIIIAGIANTTNNPQSGDHFTIAFWDGSTVISTNVDIDDNVSTTNTERNASSSTLVLSTLAYTVANITDGIRITHTVGSTGIDRYVQVILLTGTTNETVGTFNMGTSTSAQSITTGFKPDMVFFGTVGDGAPPTSTLSHAIMSFGVAHNSSSDTVSQAAVYFGAEDGQGTADCYNRVTSSNCVGQYFNNSVSWQAAASNFASTSFDITANASTGSDYIYYLAIELDDPDDGHVGVIDAATSTGNTAYTGFGFEPQCVGIMASIATAVDTNTAGYGYAFGLADGTSEKCHYGHGEDAVGTSNHTQGFKTSNLLNLTDDGGTTDAVATLSSLDSDGFTLNYSDAAASARKMLVWSIAVAGAPPVGTNPKGVFNNPFYGPFGGPI